MEDLQSNNFLESFDAQMAYKELAEIDDFLLWCEAPIFLPNSAALPLAIEDSEIKDLQSSTMDDSEDFVDLDELLECINGLTEGSSISNQSGDSRPDDPSRICSLIGHNQEHQNVDPEILEREFKHKVMASRTPTLKRPKDINPDDARQTPKYARSSSAPPKLVAPTSVAVNALVCDTPNMMKRKSITSTIPQNQKFAQKKQEKSDTGLKIDDKFNCKRPKDITPDDAGPATNYPRSASTKLIAPASVAVKALVFDTPNKMDQKCSISTTSQNRKSQKKREKSDTRLKIDEKFNWNSVSTVNVEQLPFQTSSSTKSLKDSVLFGIPNSRGPTISKTWSKLSVIHASSQATRTETVENIIEFDDNKENREKPNLLQKKATNHPRKNFPRNQLGKGDERKRTTKPKPFKLLTNERAIQRQANLEMKLKLEDHRVYVANKEIVKRVQKPQPVRNRQQSEARTAHGKNVRLEGDKSISNNPRASRVPRRLAVGHDYKYKGPLKKRSSEPFISCHNSIQDSSSTSLLPIKDSEMEVLPEFVEAIDVVMAPKEHVEIDEFLQTFEAPTLHKSQELFSRAPLPATEVSEMEDFHSYEIPNSVKTLTDTKEQAKLDEMDRSESFEELEKILESIEVPMSFYFTTVDSSQPDIPSSFCDRSGCDRKHEHLVTEDLDRSFELRNLEARSPTLKPEEVLRPQYARSTPQNVDTEPRKPSVAERDSSTSATALVSYTPKKIGWKTDCRQKQLGLKKNDCPILNLIKRGKDDSRLSIISKMNIELPTLIGSGTTILKGSVVTGITDSIAPNFSVSETCSNVIVVHAPSQGTETEIVANNIAFDADKENISNTSLEENNEKPNFLTKAINDPSKNFHKNLLGKGDKSKRTSKLKPSKLLTDGRVIQTKANLERKLILQNQSDGMTKDLFQPKDAKEIDKRMQKTQSVRNFQQHKVRQAHGKNLRLSGSKSFTSNPRCKNAEGSMEKLGDKSDIEFVKGASSRQALKYSSLMAPRNANSSSLHRNNNITTTTCSQVKRPVTTLVCRNGVPNEIRTNGEMPRLARDKLITRNPQYKKRECNKDKLEKRSRKEVPKVASLRPLAEASRLIPARNPLSSSKQANKVITAHATCSQRNKWEQLQNKTKPVHKEVT